MADNNVAGFGKDPLAPSHGESFGDQSFQSLKSKEIRDSMSPSELKFQSMALNNPSSTGWNVQSSSEVTPDGRGFRAETIATTDGVEHINGGTAEFKGRNEQRSMAMQEGDDKNFVKKASESSNTHLQEKVVIGDENSGRTEIRTSSSTSTSSSKVFQSSSTTEYENGQPVDYHQPKYLMDSVPQRMQEHPPQQYQQRPTQAEPRYEPQYYDDQQKQHIQQTEQYQRNRQETNTSQNVQTNETREQNKRYVDMDKASPEYQQHVQYLMSQPGEIISNTVEYPKPNVKMITTVKRLPDGTIVRNKRYETEETTPTAAPSQTNVSTRQTVTNTNNTQRRDSQQNYQQPKNYQGQPPSDRLRRPSDDVVDNAETVRRHTTTNDDTVETKYSTTKTSNRKFSTETTSETIHEYDDGYQVPSGGPRPKPVTNDFSTHGFPSVRPNKPTQEFANHRPQAMHPTSASPSQKMTSPPPREAVVSVRGEYEPTVTERRIPTEDGEVVIVSSEKKRSVKHQTNSERIIETDIRSTDDNRHYEQILDTTKTNQDFSTHGFPSVREPQQAPQPRTNPDYSTQGFPSARGPLSHQNTYPDTRSQPSGAMQPTSGAPKTITTPDGEVVVTSQKSHTTKYNTNTERIIETEVLGDDGRPVRRIPVDVEYISDKYTVTTPGDQVPSKGFPSVRSPTKPVADYSTPHGFPSTRDIQKPSTPDYSTQGFPSTRDTPKASSTPAAGQYVSPTKTPTSSTPTKKPSPTVEATERIIHKEKEVDAAHRAFAASLRSSSPVDQTRRDSYSTDGPRHTPRSSVSSTKTFRRDMREGSHDSETSRISSTTVTRQTPPRTVGGKTVVITERVTSSPRGTKSPSPGKNVTTTTTTTTRTVTSKPSPVKDVPKSEPSPRSSPAPTSSRSSPYPSSKSKSPLGEDDQKPLKTHPSRPLSPTSFPSSRSPQIDHDTNSPIGHKDVPNSNVDQHPAHPDRIRPEKVFDRPATEYDSDEPRTVNRENTFEQVDIDRETTVLSQRKPSGYASRRHPEDDVFITEDHIYEDIDSVTRNVKTTTKQLITNEKQPQGRTPTSSGVRPTSDTKRPIKRNEPEKPVPLAPKTQQSPKGTPNTPSQSPRKSLTTPQPTKAAPMKPTTKQPAGVVKQPVEITRKPSKPEIVKHTEVLKTKTTKYAEISQQESPERKKKPQPNGKSPAREPEPQPSGRSPQREYPSKIANRPRYGSPDREYPSEDEKEPQEVPKSVPSTKSPVRQSPFEQKDKPQGKYPFEGKEKPRKDSPERKYPSGDKMKPTQQSCKPIDKGPEPTYPESRPIGQSPKQVYPAQKPSKPQLRGDAPSEPEYPYDTEEEERLTSELTIRTTNENVKTHKEFDILVQVKPQSRPQSKSPERKSPEREYPFGIKLKPRQKPDEPGRIHSVDKPPYKPSEISPTKSEYPRKTKDHPSQEPGKVQSRGDAPSEPEYTYDTEEEERVTNELTFKTTNKNVKTRKEIDILDEDQLITTRKSPQREYPFLGRDEPRNESPERKYPSEDKKQPKQQINESVTKSPDNKPQSRPQYPSGKSQPRENAPLEKEYPSDNEEEECVTSELTIRTTNKNVKTRKEIDVLNGDKPQSRPGSQKEYPIQDRDKPRNESPERKYPSEVTTKPVLKPGEPNRKSPERTHPHDKPQSGPEYPWETKQKPGKSQPSGEAPLKPEYPSDTDEEHHTSKITIKTTNKNVKTRKDIDILVEDETIFTYHGPKKPEDRQPKKEKPLDTEQQPDTDEDVDEFKPDDRKSKYPQKLNEPTSKTPKSTRPSLYETTAEQYIRNDDIKTTNQKNVTTTIHEQFIDSERKYPREEPQEPEDSLRQVAPKSRPENEQPKKPIPSKDDKDFVPISPQQPIDKKPKSSRPSLYETTAEQYIRNDDTRNVTQKTTSTIIHEQFIEAEQRPQKPKGTDSEPKGDEPKESKTYQKSPNEVEPEIKDYLQEKQPKEQKSKPFDAKLADYPDKPQEAYTEDNEPSYDRPQQPDENEPRDKKPYSGQPMPKEKYPKDDEPSGKPTTIITNSTQKTTIREKITESEPERPDGAFISKAPEEPVQYPSFVKKGTTRRDTFEDRCREILGMETYGNTPGAYKKRPVNEVELVEEDDKETKKETVQKTTFEVKIEDCDDDDDEPLSINSVKKTLITKKAPETKPVEKKPNEEDKPETSSDSEPEVTYPEEEETEKVTTETEYIDITKKSPVVTKQSPKGPEDYTTTTEEIYITEATKRLPDTTSDSEPETSERFKENIDKKPKSRSPSSRSPQRSTKDITYETEEVVTESHVDMKKKVSSRSPTRPRSPIQDQKKPSDRSPQRTTREQVVVTKETMTMKPRSPTRPGSPSTDQKKPRSPSISPQRKPKVATYETVEVTDERTETTRKPSSQSPTRPKSPNYETKKPSSRSPQRTPKDTTFETVEVITETTTKTPSSRSPNRSVSPSTKKPSSGSPTSSPQRSTKGTTYETVEVIKEVTKKPKSPTCVDTPKKPTSQSPTRGTKSTPQKLSRSPERATATEDSEYETVVVIESSKKTTSRSPTRLTERFTASRPKSPTYDTPKKSTSQSPTRCIKSSPQKPSRSPERPTLTEDSEYESVVVTKQTDITKKTTSRSPTRITESKPEPTKRQPSKPDSPTKPTSKKSQYKTNVNEEFITTEKVFVSNVQQDYPDTTSDSEEPEKTQLREVNSKTIEITKKRNETSPTRRPESPMYGSPKDRSCETIEVTNKRIESPRKPSSKSPTRPNKEPSVGIIEVTQKRSTIDATKKTSTPTKPSLKPTMDSPKQGPKQKPKGPTKSNLNEEFITTEKVYVTGVKKDYPETASESESEPQETFVETIEITKKKKIDKTSEITKKSPYKTPAKPSVESPKKTPGKTTTTTPKDTKVTTETIKDRLRSSVRKDKTSPKKPDQVDAVSSPETSPTRLTERRRSSNISVNTEIIIDHTESSETTTTKKSKDSVYKEIIDSTTLPEKLSRRMPVTERKESAPVHRVTRKDKDTKMSRSTSENLIKVQKKPENDKPTILTPTSDKKPSPKPSADHRRPNKCFATKSINLSATDRLMTSEDMENVIIDIQHAKSSREPSPDKIVPTPVPAHLDTGKPRYPDVVQEPEDEPKRKPVIKNIPIFEEENNSYVGCHISEVSRRTYEEEEDILCTPLVEAPSSLDYPSISEKSYPTTTVITDDECLLSVHDKVSRFQNIAEEVKKPKTSSPFHREFDDKTRVPDNDDCLLSVDEKVDKFIKSAESLTSKQTTITTARDSKPKEFPEEDDLEVTECPFTTVKLAPSEPQKSPELVRHISRHISRQSDMGEPTTTEHTHRNDTTMHEECISSQTTAEEFVTHRRDQTSAVKQRRPVDDYEDDDDHGGDNDEVHISDIPDDDNDDEELIPHTAMHTIRLEERRQKDILTRPSVFDNSKTRGGSSKPTPSKPTTTATKTPTPSSRVNKTQPRYVSPAMKDSEKSRQSTPQQQQQPQRPQVKSKHSPKVAATATTTITTSHSTTTNAANKRQPHTQSPQQRRTHPDTDSDYRVSSNKNETSVKSSTTINNRQKPKQQPTTGSINGPKKSPQSPQSTVGKKSPMHTTEQRRTSTTTTHIKNAKRSHVEVDDAVSDDDDNVDYAEEFQVVEEVVPNDSETELIINSDTTVRSTNSHTNEEETVKTKQSTTINKKEPTTSSNTASKSPTSRPKMKEMTPGSMGPSAPLSSPGRSTKDHQPVNLTERSTLLKHSTTNSKYSPSTTETNESFLENRPPVKKTPGQSATYRPKTMITTTESVASRRSLFENHHNNQTKPVAKRPIVPTTTSSPSPSSGRRPSYMDHTKSSLEHIRRDSLEINKTNYTRRPSGGNDDDAPDRNSQVKFDVPQNPRSEQQQLDVEPEEEYNIEEIFDLVILEKLLETVTSYELRRRIRAQIRLVKKNMSNTTSTTTTITTRDTKTKPSSSQVISKKEEKQQHYYYKEEHQKEERLSSSTHTSPERIRTTQVTKVTRRTESPDSKYSSPRERSLSPQTRLTQTRVCSRTHERSPSPTITTEIQRKEIQVKGTKKKQYENVEHVEEIYRESTPKIRKPKAYYPIDDDEEVDMLPRATNKNEVSEEYDSAEVEERTYKKETTHRRSSRKSISPQFSPDRQKPSTTSSRTTSPQGKKPVASKVSPKSPERKTIITEQQQQQTLFTSKTQPKRTPATSAPLKSNAEPKTPVWADRKNILKSPSATPKRPVTSDSRVSSSSVSRTMKSSTNQKVSSTKSSYIEDDCITSSYGIGPTDENGLPLFGIRALKKKKPQQQQQQEPPQPEPTCETTEEVTGYVVEEKYYSDNKSKPIVERKEIIYSTNPEELEAIKEKVKETKTTTTSLKSIKHDKLESDDEPFGGNSSSYKTRTITSVRSSPEEFLESSTTKYVRRGSVKEMSEKFLQKESASMVSEKTNNYPKAGLILRTNSRKQSRDNDDMDGENNEYYETRTIQYRNDEDDEDDCQVESGDQYIVESESETESIKKTQREFKKVTSTKSSSSSRSFLNTKGEEKVITSVDDVLERMRNADNVVEDGDTAEDQEARALLNKFLGASIIMKGVESTIPTIPNVNRETKITTTTTTGGSGRQPAKHEVKTTRVTKSIKSGSSSSPVIETTCDIEEIWDEEILKQLLEQAKTYEERRKIRSRLRELMADRADAKPQQSCTSTTEKTETKGKDGAVVTTTTKVTTRTVSGTGPKPVSAFAKFKQLDRQNSQQSAKMSK